MDPLRVLAMINFALGGVLLVVGAIAYTRDWGMTNVAVAAGAGVIFVILGFQRLRTQKTIEEARSKGVSERKRNL